MSSFSRLKSEARSRTVPSTSLDVPGTRCLLKPSCASMTLLAMSWSPKSWECWVCCTGAQPKPSGDRRIHREPLGGRTSLEPGVHTRLSAGAAPRWRDQVTDTARIAVGRIKVAGSSGESTQLGLQALQLPD